MKRIFSALVFLLSLTLLTPALAVPPVFNGDTLSSTMPTFNVLAYGAKADDTTDASTAINNAIAAAISAGGGIIYFPRGTYLVNSAIAIPFTGSVTNPKQPPLRFTGDGPNWNSFLSGGVTSGGSALDLRYSGTTYNAKINTFGAGRLEIDHLTLEDNGADSTAFFATTNTTLFAHDVSCIGNPGHSGQTSNQDCWILGENGYTATSASITSGTATLTIGAGDHPFNANMVGWNVGIPGAGSSGGFYGATISAYISPTQVTLSTNASTTVTSGTAYYFGIGNDINAPFQGYGTILRDNFYSRIRRGVTFNQYANGVAVTDETYATDCGSSETFGAPYVFSGVPHFVNAAFGVRISGGTVEVGNYPYAVVLLQGDRDELFDGVSVWDPNSYFKSFLYVAASQAPAITGYSTVIASETDMSTTPAYVTGPNSSTVLVLTGEANNSGVQQANNFPAGVTSTTLTASSSVNVANGGSLIPAGGALRVHSATSGQPIQFTDQGVANINMIINDAGGVVIPRAGLQVTGGITFGSGNLNLAGGILLGSGHNACSSSSGWPCEASGSCSLSAATTCNFTVTVPAGSVCTATANSSDTTTVVESFKLGVSSTTLTVTALESSSQTATAAANVHCL